MLSSDVSSYKTNEKTSVKKIIESLKTPISFHRKMFLRYVVLPLARRAVAMREETKSLIVYGCDLSRQALWTLAHRMHSEGLIPEPILLFHLTIYEIDDFIKTRNPIIVSKAKHRKRLHQKMNNWKFDEIIRGYDFKPREVRKLFKNIKFKKIQLIADGKQFRGYNR